MNQEEIRMLAEQVAAILGNKDKGCGCNCGCPTDDMFEANAAQWSTRMSGIAAESMQGFTLQNAAMNANLINRNLGDSP